MKDLQNHIAASQFLSLSKQYMLCQRTAAVNSPASLHWEQTIYKTGGWQTVLHMHQTKPGNLSWICEVLPRMRQQNLIWTTIFAIKGSVRTEHRFCNLQNTSAAMDGLKWNPEWADIHAHMGTEKHKRCEKFLGWKKPLCKIQYPFTSIMKAVMSSSSNLSAPKPRGAVTPKWPSLYPCRLGQSLEIS